ncbi:hypothetical protein ACN28I_32920 [Archangium gephyra]|uniref:hypothetical protein n=1 Tax=Archangium gephyra TaxID=48 RepID=UPI003B81CC73
MKASFLTNRVTRTLMMGLCLMAAPAAQASGVKVLDPRLSTVKPTSPEARAGDAGAAAGGEVP